MAIIDRSFCNIGAMAYWKYRGSFADWLFKVFSCGWQVQNDFFLLQENKEDTNNEIQDKKDPDVTNQRIKEEGQRRK